MEEKEYNIITIDNTDYTEVDRIEYNNKTYIFFSDLEKPENFCIRQLETENNDEYVIGLNSEEEFNTILELFKKKYLN